MRSINMANLVVVPMEVLGTCDRVRVSVMVMVMVRVSVRLSVSGRESPHAVPTVVLGTCVRVGV